MFKSLRGMSFPKAVQTQMLKILHVYIHMIYIYIYTHTTYNHFTLLAFAHIMEEFPPLPLFFHISNCLRVSWLQPPPHHPPFLFFFFFYYFG